MSCERLAHFINLKKENMKTEITKYGSTLTRMTYKETGVRCPIALMKRKIADKKIKEAEEAVSKLNLNFKIINEHQAN